MKTKSGRPLYSKPSHAAVHPEPSEASIRACAYGLYEKGGRCDGHDIRHWFEAIALLKAEAAKTPAR